ncbi:MAG: type II toxin-antitoxin system RelE family toxin [Janthinobacterium lividum]
MQVKPLESELRALLGENFNIIGEPEKIGKPLSYTLSSYRRIRVGDIRIIYKVYPDKVDVYVIAIGPRRDDFIYKEVQKRLP